MSSLLLILTLPHDNLTFSPHSSFLFSPPSDPSTTATHCTATHLPPPPTAQPPFTTDASHRRRRPPISLLGAAFALPHSIAMAPSTCTLPWPSDPLTSTSPSLTSILNTNGVDSSRSNVCRREYTIGCNWKELQLTVLLWEFPKHSFLQLLIW